MKSLPALAMVATTFLLGNNIATAQPSITPTEIVCPRITSGFYLSGEAGAALLEDFNSSRLRFPASFAASPGARVTLEPGFTWLATEKLTLGNELETGFIYNHLHSIRNLDSGTLWHGNYYQMPILGNFVLTYRPGSLVSFYMGIGGGADYSEATMNVAGSVSSLAKNNQIDPAVQGMAGVRFRLGSRTDVGLGYQFLAALPGEGSRVGTHSIEASFTVRF